MKAYKIAALMCASLFALSLCGCGCTSELPDRSKESETEQVEAQEVTYQNTIAVTVVENTSVMPDVANLSFSIPTTTINEESGEPEDNADQLYDLIIDRAMSKDDVKQSTSGDITYISIDNLTLRDASRLKDEAAKIGATLESEYYDVYDIAEARADNLTRAFDRGPDEINILADAIGVNAGELQSVKENSTEITKRSETEIVITTSLTMEYTIEW